MFTRRRFFRSSVLAGMAGCVGMGISTAQSAQIPLRNVLWIVVDDLGYGDLTSTGCTTYATPQIDSIGKEGVTMERAYVYPVCTATRAALLTGRSPQRFRLDLALMPGDKAGLPAGCRNAAREFRAAGYHTGLIGKWHLGDQPDSLPNAQGFEEFFGFLWGETDYFRHTKKVAGIDQLDFFQNTTRQDTPGYTTDIYGTRAIRFLRENQNRPFFLCLSYNAPHYYLAAPEGDLSRFSGSPASRMYAAVVSALDDSIGRVLAELRTLGLDRNTLVVFLSDNGAPLKSPGRNAPLRGGKNDLLEGGIRTPLMARLPGVIPPGLRCREVFAVWDLLPTSLALAGLPSDTAFEGSDLSALFRGTGGSHRVPRCFRYLRPDRTESRAALEGAWKLLFDGKQNQTSLFNLENDPGEMNDLAASHPEVVAHLTQAWNARASSYSPSLGNWQIP